MTDKTDWPNEPVELTDASFNDFVSKYPVVVVDFWAPWCGPCRMVGPIIKDLAKEQQGDIAFGKLNTDQNQGIAAKYGIMSIPSMLVFKNGEKVDQVVGAMPKEALKERFSKYA